MNNPKAKLLRLVAKRLAKLGLVILKVSSYKKGLTAITVSP